MVNAFEADSSHLKSDFGNTRERKKEGSLFLFVARSEKTNTKPQPDTHVWGNTEGLWYRLSFLRLMMTTMDEKRMKEHRGEMGERTIYVRKKEKKKFRHRPIPDLRFNFVLRAPPSLVLHKQWPLISQKKKLPLLSPFRSFSSAYPSFLCPLLPSLLLSKITTVSFFF
jgi:hypothetical protein